MFIEPTVFILGAGASWHYGYPTGEELVKKIIQKATYLQNYLEFSAADSNEIAPTFLLETTQPNPIKQRWVELLQNCTTLRAGLEQVNPLVIDYYLGWNPRLQSIGRLLIAWVILECEHVQLQSNGNINRREALINSPLEAERTKSRNLDLKKYKDDWCRFVIHKLAVNCRASSDIHNSNVRFVTFNYDISLERALGQGLTHIEMFKRSDVERFLGEDRIVHIYGKVRESPFTAPVTLNWSEQGRHPKELAVVALGSHLHGYKKFLDEIYSASRGIRVIDPDDKETDQAAISSAAGAIRNATYVYIFGYGFDENNSARLNLGESLHCLKPTRQSVSFTNYGNASRINKRASHLFFRNEAYFSSEGKQVEALNQTRYEKSHRNVYDALELDFDLPSR